MSKEIFSKSNFLQDFYFIYTGKNIPKLYITYMEIIRGSICNSISERVWEKLLRTFRHLYFEKINTRKY